MVPDELLCLVAEACFPMKKIVLSNCVGYSFAGVSFLVRHYPLLEYLDLERTFFFLQIMISLSYPSRLVVSLIYTLVIAIDSPVSPWTPS